MSLRTSPLAFFVLAACSLPWACSSESGTAFNRPAGGGQGGDASTDGLVSGGSAGQAGGAGAAGAAGSTANGGSAGASGGPGAGGSPPDAGSDVGKDVDFGYDSPVIDVAKEACAQTVVKAEPVPLDLYFMLDTSGSMSGSNITALHEGVVNFANDPGAAGTWVTGQRFAIGGYSESCNPADYASPAVPWNVLPYPQFNSWVNGLTATGYTPSVPALQGAVNACKARIAAAPTHKCVVVFVTDGNPEGNCPPTQSAAQTPLGNIAADSCAAGIPVFAIGFPNLPSLGQGIINHIAAQGCTGTAFIIQAGSMGSQFTDQLKAIQKASLSCEFLMPVPEAGVVDTGQVSLVYKPGNGDPEQTLPRVNTAAECNGDGWYYDDNTSPTKLVLCPSSCTKVKADTKAEVNVNLGCFGS